MDEFGSTIFLHLFVLSGKALFNPFVLRGEFLIHGLQNDRGLFGKEFLQPRLGDGGLSVGSSWGGISAWKARLDGLYFQYRCAAEAVNGWSDGWSDGLIVVSNK